MNDRSENPGHALAAAGGAGLALSLWMPWYTVRFPQSAVNSLSQSTQGFGALGSLIRTGAQLLSQLGPFHVTAWQAFKTMPAVLLVAAVVGGGLALLALSDRAGNTAKVSLAAGAVAAVLVGYRVVDPPVQSSFVHPAWGIYLAAVSALAMLAGGYLASRAGDVEPTVLGPLAGAHLAVPGEPCPPAAAAVPAEAGPSVPPPAS